MGAVSCWSLAVSGNSGHGVSRQAWIIFQICDEVNFSPNTDGVCKNMHLVGLETISQALGVKSESIMVNWLKVTGQLVWEL